VPPAVGAEDPAEPDVRVSADPPGEPALAAVADVADDVCAVVLPLPLHAARPRVAARAMTPAARILLRPLVGADARPVLSMKLRSSEKVRFT